MNPGERMDFRLDSRFGGRIAERAYNKVLFCVSRFLMGRISRRVHGRQPRLFYDIYQKIGEVRLWM